MARRVIGIALADREQIVGRHVGSRIERVRRVGVRTNSVNRRAVAAGPAGAR
jgi:hypothetical protein